jgi:hypothetical protein
VDSDKVNCSGSNAGPSEEPKRVNCEHNQGRDELLPFTHNYQCECESGCSLQNGQVVMKS